MCFHKNLQKHRINKGLSQRAIAEIIGVAPSTYSLYEKGAREPDVEKIKLIAKTLNISADCLLFDCEQNNNEIFNYSINEQNLITSYRAHPEMKSAIDKLLGIDDKETEMEIINDDIKKELSSASVLQNLSKSN